MLSIVSVAARGADDPVDADLATDKGDLDTRGAVHDVVVHFYREIVFDDLLEPVFGEVAEVDWSEHIPKLIDYWCRVLLGQPGYAGAIVAAHRQVHDLEAFRVEHFDRWYALWVASVDTLAAGPMAEKAKRHAARIAASLARQLLGETWQPPNGSGRAGPPPPPPPRQSSNKKTSHKGCWPPR
jgi:hemoglobin